MNRKKIQHKIVNSLLSLFAVTVASSAVAAMPERSASLHIMSESPSAIESGASGQFGVMHTAIQLPLEEKTRRAESFQSNLSIELTEFDWRDSSAADNEYIWLSMPVFYQQQRSRNSVFIIQAEPGLMTDGNTVDLNSVGINGSLIAVSYTHLTLPTNREV